MSKLSDMLRGNEILISQIFSIDNICTVLELVVKEITFYVYVQSKYEFDTTNSKSWDLTELSDNYDDKEMKEDGINNEKVTLNNDLNQDQTEENLVERYDQKVDLNNSRTSKTVVSQIKKILTRLNKPLSETPYGLTIVYKNILGISHYDGESILFYRINNFRNSSNKYRLFVNIDLEQLYVNSSRIYEDINVVKLSLRNILQENIFRNMSNVSDVNVKNTSFNNKKYLQKYYDLSKRIKDVKRVLNNLQTSKEELQEEMEYLRQNENMTNIHHIGKLEQEFKNIVQYEEEHKKELYKLNTDLDNFLVLLDKICFDIYVMKTMIKKRFYELENL